MISTKHTVRFCYLGYLTQAITINFAPLLFITFEKTYNISLLKISLLIAISFATQFLADLFEACFSKHLNVRATCVIAHICAVAGMTGFAYLPDILPDPYVGLVISVVIAAVGGGLIEVLISPIAEACQRDEKGGNLSMLHSFYSWGLAGVVILSTLFFTFVGIEHWRILAVLWALIPAAGAVGFIFVPLCPMEKEGGEKSGRKSIFSSGIFWLFMLMMFCSGAAEQSMSQWASSFAESGLGVSKTIGDLLGPCAFAIFMGSARVFYAKFSHRVKLSAFMMISSVLCIVSYLLAALAPFPLLSLLGCALCGLSVGIMWPGTYSMSSVQIPWGGVQMFAMLAFAGDIGCLIGPTAAGWVAGLFGDNLKVSFILSIVFPVTIIFMIMLLNVLRRRAAQEKKGI